MAKSTGYILAAAGIAAANEAIFAPITQHRPLWHDFNWRLIPATAIAGFTLAGLEAISEPLGVGLAILALLGVVFFPVGNAPSALENATTFLGIRT